MAFRPQDAARRLFRAPVVNAAPPPPTDRRSRLDVTALEDRTVPSTTVSVANTGSPNEWGDTATFRFTRVGPTTSALTINTKMEGTATNGADYSGPGTTVVIPAGKTTKDVTVTAVDDAIPEPGETAIVRILSGSGYTIGGGGQAQMMVGDNDAELTFALGSYPGAIGYTVPYDQVDASKTSQSIALPDFQLNLAGKLLPGSGSVVVTGPSAQFSSGVFTGITFAYDTSLVADYPFNSVSMSGLTLSAANRVGGGGFSTTVSVAQPGTQFDFSSYPVGTLHDLTVTIRDANDAVIETATIRIAAGATRQQVVTAVAAALDGDKVEVVAKPDATLLVRSKKEVVAKISFEATDPTNNNQRLPLASGQIYYATNFGVSDLRYNGGPIAAKP